MCGNNISAVVQNQSLACLLQSGNALPPQIDVAMSSGGTSMILSKAEGQYLSLFQHLLFGRKQ